MKIRLFPLALTACSIGLLISGYSHSAFWQGALSVFLLWWAHNDRKQGRNRDQNAHLVAEHAPELVGKDFVQSAAYALEAVDTYKSKLDLAGRLRLAEALSDQQAQWASRGEPMPPWATLKLLRQLEARTSTQGESSDA